MEKTVTISFNWDISDFENLSSDNLEQLQQEAEYRIYEMRKEGYHSGELCTIINIDGEEATIYGWWSFSCD